MAVDPTYNTKVYMHQDGAILEVATGGLIEVVASGGLTVAGASVDPANTTVANAMASTSTNKKMVMGTHTVTAGEAIATTLTIATGLTIVAAVVQILSAANICITGDAVITKAAGNLTVANGASTLTLVAGQIVNWIAYGT